MIAVLGLGIGIGATVSKQSGGSTASSSAPGIDASTGGGARPAIDGPGGLAEPSVDETSSTTTTTMATTTTDPEAGALAALNRQLRADQGRADSAVVDQWVPQLSSKKLGITDKDTGITYGTYRSILDDFRALQRNYGDVLLLDSGAFSTFSRGGLYVTVAAVGFPTADGANGWCDDHGISPNNCFAKFLSHTVPSGPDAQEYRG